MRRPIVNFGAWVCSAILTLSLAGCSLSKAYPTKRHFYVAVTRSLEARSGGRPVLRVRPLEISRAFAGKGFVSRTSDFEYRSDYYTEFFTAPSEMLTSSVSHWMASSGVFSEVVGASSALTPERVIEGHIDGLYVDLRDESQVRATISLQLRYIDDSGSLPEALMAKEYSRAIEIPSAVPESVVQGWNQALEEILTEFESDVIGTTR